MRYPLTITCFCIFLLSLASTAQTDTGYRVVKFVNTYNGNNRPLHFGHNNLVDSIISSFKNGSLKFYDVDLKNEKNTKLMSVNSFNKRRERRFEVEQNPNEYYGEVPASYPLDDFRIWAIDKSVKRTEKDMDTVFHYVHFYVYGKSYVKEGMDPKIYMFSLKWHDLMEFLNDKFDLRLMPSGPNCFWWKNEVFMYDQTKSCNESFLSAFQKLGDRHPETLKFKSITGIKEYSDQDPTLAFTYKENGHGSGFPIKEVVVAQRDSGNLNGIKMVFDYEKLLKLANDSNWFLGNNILSVHQVFGEEKLEYEKDTVLLPIGSVATVHAPMVRMGNETYKLEIVEEINLDHPYNHHLKSLVKILHNNALAGNITLYGSSNTPLKDSLWTNTENFRNINPSLTKKMEQSLEIEECEQIFKASGMVKKNTGLYIDRHYYTVMEEFPVQELKDITKFRQRLVKVEIPFFTPDETNKFRLVAEYEFDSKGKVLSYKIVDLLLVVRPDLNYSGKAYPICTVKWDEFEKIAIGDPLNATVYGKKKNLCTELMEKRQFFPCLYFTGLVKVKK